MTSATLAVSDVQPALVALAKMMSDFAKQTQELGAALQRVVTMGLQGTAEGNRLAFAWTMLSRQIASVFLPVINYVTEKILALAGWFKGLTVEGQGIIRIFGGIALGFAMLSPLLAIVSAVLSPMAVLFGAIAGALSLFFTQSTVGKAIIEALGAAVDWLTSKWGDIIDALDLVGFSIGVAFDSVVAAFASLGLAILKFIDNIVSYIPFMGDASKALHEFVQQGQTEVDQLVASANREFVPRDRTKGKEAGGQVNPSGFGNETIAPSWERVMSAANKQDGVPEKQLEVQKAQLAAINGVIEAVKGNAPGRPDDKKGDH